MKIYDVRVNGKLFEVEIAERAGQAELKRVTPIPESDEASTQVAKEEKAAQNSVEKKSVGTGKTVDSPMPGSILEIHVRVGDRVEKGDILFIIEAMKMEIDITAPFAGQVTEILVDKGDIVEAKAPLLYLG